MRPFDILEKMIDVMQAYRDGAEIEYASRGDDAWSSASTPLWDWSKFVYRVKPPDVAFQEVKLVGWLTDGGQLVWLEDGKLPPLKSYKRVMNMHTVVVTAST